MKIGIAGDHGGFVLLRRLGEVLREAGHDTVDFGANELDPDDDYPSFVIPLAQAVARGDVERGIALCGSGVGACIAANKVPGVRAAVVHEVFSARQGVEDDDMNVMCLGARVIGEALALELVWVFLAAEFSGATRHIRRLGQIAQLERGLPGPSGAPPSSP
jgi:ribose 5-phosphate isomerase B